MYLDASTLAFAAGLATVSSGLFLLGYWLQDRLAWSAFWWGIANCNWGVGVGLLSLDGVLPFVTTHILGPQILNVGAVLTFAAARIFNFGSADPYRIAGGAAAWSAVQMVAGVLLPEQFVSTLGAAGSAAIFGAAAIGFWQGRDEQLRGRPILIAVLVLQSVGLAMIAAQYGSATHYSMHPSLSLLGMIQFFTLAYAVGSSLVLTMMLKERNEEEYRREALTDPLTGLPNRRAFMDRAQRILDRQGRDGRTIALLMFDLDHFKRVNDTFGHAVGDQVLRLFADTLLAGLRPLDPLARMGGEEFVAIAPGADGEAAIAIANRIRNAFQRASLFLDGQRIGATVSVGIASSGGKPCTIIDMLADADSALYRAKEEGRNRVVLGKAMCSVCDDTNVVRLA